MTTTIPMLSLIILLQWLIELNEIFYLLNYCFITKEYNSGIAKWNKCTEQGKQEV